MNSSFTVSNWHQLGAERNALRYTMLTVEKRNKKACEINKNKPLQK